MIEAKIATLHPYGLKTAHPGLFGLLVVSDGSFLTWQSTEVTVVPGGPRLRIGAPVTADADPPYARNIQLVSPVPFP